MKTEDLLQANCFKWANNNYCLKTHNPRCCIFSVPNGGTRHKLEAMKMIATGLKAGVSDMIGLFPNGKTVFFEFKTETGTQQPNQIEFQKTVEALGFKYYLIRDEKTFQEIWKSYLDF